MLTFLLLLLLGSHAISAPVGMYDTAHVDVACMANKVLAQAPDHQWGAELHQLLSPPLHVGECLASYAVLVAPPESPVLPQLDCIVDRHFVAAAAYVDLVSLQPSEPIFLTIH